MMFNKLRKQMLLMNLGIISLLMIAAFSAIFFVTSNNIYQSINQELYRIVDIKKTVKMTLPILDTLVAFPREEKSSSLESERTLSFVIETDDAFNIYTVHSFFESDLDFFNHALEKAIAQGDFRDQFDIETQTWAYLIKKIGSGYIIGFYDMTAQQKVLERLILTFVVVSLLMIAIIYFISRFLTERSIQPIKEAFMKQKQFISDASHELKTPLAVIQTNVDVLLSNDSSEHSKWLTYIKLEVERMRHLTNNLLYLTQMENSEENQNFKCTFNLSERLEHLLLGFEVLAFEKHINFSSEVSPDINLYGNSEQIVQVFMILFDNAIKFTPEKGSIQLVCKVSTHQIKLTLHNSGEGIPEADLPFIFDRFYRVDKSRSRSDNSYGLGLSIAKTIIEQHNGKITCDSSVNEGTTFTIKFKY